MEIIQIEPIQQEFTNFMNMEDGIAKRIEYYKSMMSRTFREAVLCKKEDGHIYYSVKSVMVKKGKNCFYVKRHVTDGFTIDPKGKLKVWFNKTVFQMPFLNSVFHHYNFNWLHQKMQPYLTKTILEKMFNGKLTNNRDVAAAYLKMMKIDCSATLFVKMLECNTGITKEDFLRQSAIAKDVNHLLEEYISRSGQDESRNYDRYNMLNDMVQEAQILEEKIDYKWSTLRLKEVHKQWTSKIMEIEIQSLEDSPVDNIDKYDRYTPSEFKLLKTQREVFFEGKTMHHCLYTSYWTSIKNGNYLAYHININGEEATLGVYVDRHSKDRAVYYSQCYSYYNKRISPELECLVANFVADLNEQVMRDGIIKKELEILL